MAPLPAHLVFTVEPGGVTGGAAITPAITVTIEDPSGQAEGRANAVVTVAIATNPAAGTLTGKTSVTAVNGVATFSSLSIDKAGAGYTLAASASGITGVTSSAFAVEVGPAARLAFTGQPSNANAGAVITPAVQVTAQDAGGNTVTGFTGNVTVLLGASIGGASLSGTTTVAAVGGVATFSDLTVLPGGGSDTLYATSVTLRGAASKAFVITVIPTILDITTTTTGAAQPDGYTVCVDIYSGSYSYGCGWSGSIGLNGTVSVPVNAGTHYVELDGVPANCSLAGDTLNPRTVRGSGPTAVPFSISCLDTGTVHLTVATTGTDPDPNGYYVCVSRGGNACYWSSHVLANDVVAISGVSAETHTVSIGDVAGNCTVSGGTSQTATVPVHGSTDVVYTIGCVVAERIAFSASGTITVMRVDGLETESVTHGFAPAWSADGARLAYECGQDICVINADGSGFAQLTTDAANNLHPSWSPDGTKLAFSASHGGVPDLWVMAANGSGAVQLTQNAGFVGRPAWSPDGTKIAFDCQVTAANDDICVVNADGTGLTRLTSDPARDYGAAWSRDGSTLAFATARYGADEIVLMSAAGGSVTRIGTGLAGSEPTWSPDGSQLGFVRLDQSSRANILTAHKDGSGVVTLTLGDQPAWKPHP